MSMEARLRLKDDLDNRLKEVNPEATPGIDIWISELIQNALDATWGDKTGASKSNLSSRNKNSFSSMMVDLPILGAWTK